MVLRYSFVMKMIKKSLILILLIASFLDANAPLVEKAKLPLSESLPMLKTITQHAIHIGQGKTDVYVFVDPKCPRSREFVTMIAQSKRMQSLYHYQIFLYELKRFKTKNLIETIYASSDPKKMMLEIMVEKKEQLTMRKSTKARSKIKAISGVAHRIDVYKRPYLVLVKKRKK
jgi:hypothetical protein